MPQTQDPSSQLAKTFTSLSPERQSALLKKMSPDQKANLHSALQAHVSNPVQSPEFQKTLQNARQVNATSAMYDADAAARRAQTGNPLLDAPKEGEDPRAVFGRQTQGTILDLLNGLGQILNPNAAPHEAGIAATGGMPALVAHRMFVQPSLDQLEGGATPLGAIPVLGPLAAHMGDAAGSGNYVGAAADAAQLYEMGAGAAGLGRGVGPNVGVTPGFLRRQAQRMAGVGPESITHPLVEAQVADIAKHHEALGEHATKQSAADSATEAANRGITEDAFRKAGETKAAFDKRIADQKAAQAAKVQAVEAANTEARRVADLRKTGEDSLKDGHQAVGESIADAAQKLRQEGNEKYATVREATANDPGVPLADLSREARTAQGMLKGSQENIKQFRDLLRRGDEAADPHELLKQAGVSPTLEGNLTGSRPSPAYADLLSRIEAQSGGSIPFDELQGYSSEIGSKLAAGNLPGDVYQALKYLKDKIDTAKATIAERSGAGPQLRDAESFWHSYMDTFYDKDSAVAKVRKNVGVKDPQFYAEPFTTGKSAQVGANKLRGVNPDGTPNALATSRHAAELNQIADAAMNLRDTHAQIKSLPNLKESPLPGAPKPIAKPKPVEVEYKGPTEIPAPKAPEDLTAGDIAQARKNKLLQKSATMGEFSKWDVVRGVLSKGTSEIARVGLSKLLRSDSFIEMMSKPTAGDLKFVDSLPEPQRARLRKSLIQEISQPTSGKSLNVAPSMAKALGIASATIPKTAGEARDRLKAIQ